MLAHLKSFKNLALQRLSWMQNIGEDGVVDGDAEVADEVDDVADGD